MSKTITINDLNRMIAREFGVEKCYTEAIEVSQYNIGTRVITLGCGAILNIRFNMGERIIFKEIRTMCYHGPMSGNETRTVKIKGRTYVFTGESCCIDEQIKELEA